MSNELPVISAVYDLLKWAFEHTARFSKHHRHGLGYRLESQLHQLLEQLVEAKYTRNKATMLQQAWLHLEHVRQLMRLSKDLGLLSVSSYGFACDQLASISQQVSSWRQSVERRT